MIEITDKKKCCGCTACSGVCPGNCIKMVEDGEGFLYPQVDTASCIECGLCEKICPVLNSPVDFNRELNGYVARDKRQDVLNNGTSGSMYTSIMEYVLAMGGVVYGVVVDTDMVVRHIRIESAEDSAFRKIPGSKYCRSDIEGIYARVLEDLKTNRTVVFSGTPCQAAGLKAFLRKDFDNLYIIDFVCHGNPSPLMWKKYVEHQQNKYGSRIMEARFRNKTYGYHSATMKLVFENGKVYCGSARVDYMLKAFLDDLCSRPSCFDCSFKDVHHASDLTIYDSWHAHELCGVEDDDRGYTNVIVQSEKGKTLLDEIASKLELYPADVEQAIALDGIMVRNSVKWNAKREIFFDGLRENPLALHCKKFMSISLKDHFIEKAKVIWYWKKRRV